MRFLILAATAATMTGVGAAQAQTAPQTAAQTPSQATPQTAQRSSVRLHMGAGSSGVARLKSERGVNVYRGAAPKVVDEPVDQRITATPVTIIIVNNTYARRYYGLRTQGFYSGIPYGHPRFTQGFYSGGPRGS